MSENKKRVIDRIKFVADNGDADSQFILATMYDRLPEYRNKKEAFKYYKLAADNGIAEAQYVLGDIYYYNKDLIFLGKDLELAFKYYKLAADNGYGPAQYKIAFIYEVGLGKYDPKTGKTSVVVAKSSTAAFKYYKLAAYNGIVQALIRVLEICEEKNKPKVFEEFYNIASICKDEHIRNYAEDLSQKIRTRRKKQ